VGRFLIFTVEPDFIVDNTNLARDHNISGVGLTVGLGVELALGVMDAVAFNVAACVMAGAVGVALVVDRNKSTSSTMMKNITTGLRARMSIPRSPSRSNITVRLSARS